MSFLLAYATIRIPFTSTYGMLMIYGLKCRNVLGGCTDALHAEYWVGQMQCFDTWTVIKICFI